MCVALLGTPRPLSVLFRGLRRLGHSSQDLAGSGCYWRSIDTILNSLSPSRLELLDQDDEDVPEKSRSRSKAVKTSRADITDSQQNARLNFSEGYSRSDWRQAEGSQKAKGDKKKKKGGKKAGLAKRTASSASGKSSQLAVDDDDDDHMMRPGGPALDDNPNECIELQKKKRGKPSRKKWITEDLHTGTARQFKDDVVSFVHNLLGIQLNPWEPLSDDQVKEHTSPFHWKQWSDGVLKDGLFEGELIVYTFTAHLTAISCISPRYSTHPTPPPPIGALILCIQAAERALRAWSTGTQVLLNKVSNHSSKDNWGDTTKERNGKHVKDRCATKYVDTIIRAFNDAQWAAIHDTAGQWVEKKKKMGSSRSSSMGVDMPGITSDEDDHFVLKADTSGTPIAPGSEPAAA
ncbi:hypothetical protein C8J57DRAFT_1713271 [Mycena rebaudengoi]|nr:hypothetical protein C8J57DRAFT_1713271 [Mycena rebaudengoi]